MAQHTSILGIDPGYDRIGWSLAAFKTQPLQIIAYGCIQTKKSESLFERYQQLTTDLAEIINRYRPDVAAIETLFFSKNQTTAMRVAEARGLIIGELLQQQIQIAEYNPMQVKLVAAGHGRADKAAIAKMVKLQVTWPLHQPPTKSTLDDTLDAVALCLTHSVLSSQRV